MYNLRPGTQRGKPFFSFAESGFTYFCQLAAAMDNLTHIFNVPEMIAKCTDLISEGKLLHAHKL